MRAQSIPGVAAIGIRYYQPGDEDGILRLFEASFSRWPNIDIDVAPIDHLRWKIEAGHEAEKTHIVAEAAGEIVGARLCLVRDYLSDDGTITVRTDTDTSVLPGWRGRGINTALSDFIVEASPAELMLTSTRDETLLRRDRFIGHRPMRNRLISTSCTLSSARLPETAVTVSEVQAFDERVIRLWPQAAEPFEFIAFPSLTWLNWRFCDPRSGRGFVLQAEDNGDVRGFVVARTSGAKAHIAYLLVLPEANDIIEALLITCLLRLRDAGFAEVTCTLPQHHPYRPPVEALGFTEHRRRIPVTTRLRRRDDPERPFRHDPRARVHLMLGDFDFV